MWPTLLLVRIGGRRGVPLPLPLFILWPLLLVAWLCLGLGYLGLALSRAFARRPRGESLAGLWLALRLVPHLRGVLVDVQAAAGERVYIRII